MDPIIFFSAFAVVFTGAIVQAATGLGAGLLIVPLLALINIQFVPGPLIFASLALSWLMAYRGRHNIRTQHLGVIFTGLVAGMVLAVLMLSAVSLEHLATILGLCILAAVLISALVKNFSFTPPHKLIAAALSGFMGTTAAIGAPILALLYQYENGKVIRATLGMLYFVASLLMLLFLHVGGRFAVSDLLLGLYLIPGFLAGY